MVIEVRGSGTLVPEEIRWIAASTEGRVERIPVLLGSSVRANTTLVVLDNPELEREALGAELELQRAIAELEYLKVDLQRQLLTQQAQAAKEAEVAQLRGLFELRQKQVSTLQVKAGIDGVLQQTPVEVGQQIKTGEILGKVAVPGRLKAELQIPETQAQDVQLGLRVVVDTRNGLSTLLSIAGLLDTPTKGKYRLNGQAVEDLAPSQRARIRNREIGFIFQNFNLIGDLTVFENVELPLTYRGMPASERKRRVAESLERVGMGHRTKHYPAQLSGGEQQRAAVARALAGEPSILLADEPTGNLDSENGAAVMQLLSKLHRDGATIGMVTHDSRYASYAERQVRLFDGRVVAEERQAGNESGIVSGIK